MYEYDDKKIYEKYRDEERLFEIKKHTVGNFYPHFHFATEICCVRSGGFDYIINGKRGRAEAGDIVFINSGETHQYFESDSCEVTVAVMSEIYSGDFIYEFGEAGFATRLTDRKVNEQIFKLADEFYLTQKTNCFLENKIFANKVYALLCRNYPLSKRDKNDVLLSNILKYIYDNYKNRITLETVAEQFSYSPVTVSRLFQQKIGVDFRVFVNGVRASKAQQMLFSADYKDWNVIQIAMECGFTSVATFYRSYKRRFGCLPDKDKPANDAEKK